MLNDKPADLTLKLLNKYQIWFANIDGIIPEDEVRNSNLEKGKPMCLKTFLDKSLKFHKLMCHDEDWQDSDDADDEYVDEKASRIFRETLMGVAQGSGRGADAARLFFAKQPHLLGC